MLFQILGTHHRREDRFFERVIAVANLLNRLRHGNVDRLGKLFDRPQRLSDSRQIGLNHSTFTRTLILRTRPVITAHVANAVARSDPFLTVQRFCGGYQIVPQLFQLHRQILVVKNHASVVFDHADAFRGSIDRGV